MSIVDCVGRERMISDSVVVDKVQIIGLMLVRNEETYIAKVLCNILAFCDKVIVADNLSADRTAEIVQALSKEHGSKLEYHLIKHSGMSHDLISGYAGKNVWIFAVDGDELYDPFALSLLRERITSGEFENQWMILGNVLNCVELDIEKKSAKGYLAPPCRSMTKLYNFLAIEQWAGPCPERLHGGNITFRSAYSNTDRFYLYKEVLWEDSCFRCLHLCFLPRSNREKDCPGKLVIRKNIADQLAENLFRRCLSWVKKTLRIEQKSPWKREKYMQGELVEIDISSFFS